MVSTQPREGHRTGVAADWRRPQGWPGWPGTCHSAARYAYSIPPVYGQTMVVGPETICECGSRSYRGVAFDRPGWLKISQEVFTDLPNSRVSVLGSTGGQAQRKITTYALV